MSTSKLTIRDANGKARALQYIEAREDYPFRVAIADGEEERTKAQNSLVHVWFREIAAQRGDVTAIEQKAQCNREYGKAILHRDDPDWAKVWDYMFEPLPYAAQIIAIRRLDLPFTRNMVVRQLNEYMDQMSRDYRSQGFILTDPEARKYESEMR